MTVLGNLDRKRIVVVCGSGGVGKTTVSAALALGLAREGRRVTILAVDPSRRLATSLGLPRKPGERTTVHANGVKLDALLLDTKRTFDELVEHHAGSPERRDRILSNRFYQRMADTLSGTHEYMAMERLYELATTEDWERIVIDTPPTRSALSFIDAPKRMTDFLGGHMLRWLLWPYRTGGKAGLKGMSLGARTLSKTIGRVAGAELLQDLGEFLAAFEGMYEGFKQRAVEVTELLRDRATGFVIVTAPERRSLEEARHFVDRLTPAGMDLVSVLVNRWTKAPSARAPEEVRAQLARGTTKDRVVSAALENAERLAALEERGHAAVEPFHRSHPGVPLALVPQLPGDVHDVEGLERLIEHLSS